MQAVKIKSILLFFKLFSVYKFHQYIYIIGHYNPSVRIINLVSHITYDVCVNFIHKWGDLQFKFDSERQIFWENFHGNFCLLSESLPIIFWEEIAEEIFFVFFFFMSGLGANPGISSNKPIHRLLDHGDFTNTITKMVDWSVKFDRGHAA